MILNRLFGRSKEKETALALYGAAVRQARSAFFYRTLDVPDTLDGRFDMVVLHVFLLLDRLENDESGKVLQQHIIDIMVDDLDCVLREMGVGDLSVSKKIRVMVEAFYGRCAVYRKTLEGGNAEVLKQVLARNIFPEQPVNQKKLAELAAYVQECRNALRVRPLEQVLHAEGLFSALSGSGADSAQEGAG